MSRRRDKKTRTKKPSPPASGLAMAAGIWVWGAMAFYAPTYFEITSGAGKGVSNVLGAILIVVSLAGSLIELSKLWKTEALSYWGAGLVFLLPALGLHLVIVYHPLAHALEIVAKIGIYVLVFFGVPFLFLGIPHFFWKPDSEQETQTIEKPTPEEKPPEERKGRKETLKTAIAVAIVLLNLATAIIKFTTTRIP